MKQHWWKALGAALVLYAIVGGLLFEAPRLPILHETIRNLHFHVPMWFGMILILGASVAYSIRYLRTGDPRLDVYATACVKAGLFMGSMGLATGMIWAKFAWGAFWSGDPKQNASAVGMLIYLGYLLLRDSFDDEQRRNQLSSIYNIFAYATFIPLIFVLPRLTDSLHPGNGGNPGFNAYDLDANLRLVFYPAVIGWTLLGAWMAQLQAKTQLLQQQIQEEEEQLA
jgi:heme exporter protein C